MVEARSKKKSGNPRLESGFIADQDEIDTRPYLAMDQSY